MKNYLTRSFSLLLSIFFLGCASYDELKDETLQEPTAEFLFKIETKSLNKIDFENKSINATDYLWDFGDNESSLEKNPSHTYNSPGTYKIQLIVSGPGGTSVVTKNITITTSVNPNSVKITKVTVVEMPFNDQDGHKWDRFNVQFSIVDEETYKDQISSSTFKNISKTELPLSWTLTDPKVITDLTKEYEFSISRVEGMFGYRIGGHMYAKMEDYTTGSNKYPKTIILEYNNPSVPSQKVTFFVDLVWQ